MKTNLCRIKFTYQVKSNNYFHKDDKMTKYKIVNFHAAKCIIYYKIFFFNVL